MPVDGREKREAGDFRRAKATEDETDSGREELQAAPDCADKFDFVKTLSVNR
jgi:hypothetical protein